MTVEEVQKQAIPLLRAAGVKRAGVFGSVARGEARLDSDVDIAVEIPAGFGLLNFVGLKQSLEQVIGRKVDLVEYAAIKPLLKEHIMRDHTNIL
jgi:uncharacterized protein